MSYLLHYFEKNNPNATWEDYAVKSDTVIFSFNDAINKKGGGLLIEENALEYELQKYQSYMISDGISSDRIFMDKSKRSAFLKFLNNRIQVKKIIPCFILILCEERTFSNMKLDSDVDVIYNSYSDIEKAEKLEYGKLYLLDSKIIK